MNAVAAPPSEPDTFVLPTRPRRRLAGRPLAAVSAVLLVALGFLAGVRVEKSQVTTSSPTTSAAGASRAALAGGGGRGAAGGGGAGFARAFAGGSSGAGGSFGTVSAISGHTVYLTDVSGNTIAVTLTSATKLTKSQSVPRSALRPGDSIIVQGIKRANGAITAASVSDTGARSTGTATGAGSGSPSSAGAAVNSLFNSSGPSAASAKGQ